MATNMTQAIAPAVSMLATAGVSLAVVTVVSFLVARKFGGQNRRKRQAVFSVMSFIGVLCECGHLI